jgi:hypothetical protein
MMKCKYFSNKMQEISKRILIEFSWNIHEILFIITWHTFLSITQQSD